MGFSNYNPAERMSERLTLNCDMNTAYNAFLKAVNDLPKFKLDSENRTLNRLTVKTKASLFSWGEIMTVQLNSVGDQTEVIISSGLKTSIGSQGIMAQQTVGVKTKKNIDILLNEASKYL